MIRLLFTITCCYLLILYWPIPNISSVFGADEQQTGSRCSSLASLGVDGGVQSYPPGRGTAEEADLRVVVPLITSFPQFVDCSDPAHVKGWCVEVFERALSLLPPPMGKPSFTLNYTCLPPSNLHPTGSHYTTSYGYIIEQLKQNGYDVAVGDITVAAKRLSEADFTQPFMPSGIVIFSKKLYDDNHRPSSWWLFLAPFSATTWYTIFGVCIVVGLVLAMVEHPAHFKDRHAVTNLETFRELSGLVTNGLILLEREHIQSGIGKLLLVAWLFFALLLGQSYNAGLNSYLTAKKLSPTTLDINYLQTSNAKVGHWGGSVVREYLTKHFQIPEEKLIAFNTLDHYKGNLTEGVAIVDEFPYVNLVLSSFSSPCDYVISHTPLTSEGFGLALRKNSTLTHQLSIAILNLSESGCLEELSKNLTRPKCNDPQGYPTQIGLTSTILLYVPLITIYLACIFIHSLNLHRCFWVIGSYLSNALSQCHSLKISTRYF